MNISKSDRPAIILINIQKRMLFVIISIVLFLISCEKEKIVEVEVYKDHSWTTHPSFQYENSILLNSLSVDSSFMVVSGTTFFSKVGNIADYGTYDSIFDDDFIKQYNIDIKPINRKISITSQITVETEPESGRVNFISTAYYGSSNSYLTDLYMGEIDTTFIGFDIDRPTWNDCIAINNNGQVLIPYQSLSNDEFQLRLLLVNTQQTGNGIYPTEILDTKILKIEDEYQNRIDYLQSINDVFFVTTQTKTYRIDAQGNLSQKFDDYQLYGIIPKSEILYAFGYDYVLRQNEFLYSTNYGITWNKISISEPVIAYLNFAEISDTIIGYYKSQIWQFTFNENGYSVVELDNDGLSGKIITSIAEYKNRVYATTYSGLFYQDIDDLFKAIETESDE